MPMDEFMGKLVEMGIVSREGKSPVVQMCLESKSQQEELELTLTLPDYVSSSASDFLLLNTSKLLRGSTVAVRRIR